MSPARPTAVVATFDVRGQQFKAYVKNPKAIQQLLDLESGASSASIPIATVRKGRGWRDHNAPWSWHLDPEDLVLAEMAIEVCDGAPQYLEEHLDEWLTNPGRYCPWSARLLAVEAAPAD